MRKLAIVIVVVVVVIVAILLTLPHLIDVNQYRGQIQAELQQRLNRPVQLGLLSLGLFPPRVEANNVIIGEDPSFHSATPFAQVAQLDVSVKLFSLLSKNVEIESLELKRPKIELIRNPQGVWNFATLGSPPAPAPASNQPSAPAKQGAPSGAKQPASSNSEGLSLGELKITDGQIAVTDYQKHQPRAVYDHIDLTLNDYAPGRPFSLDLSAHLPGSGSETLSLSGSGGPIDSADVGNTPFKGKLKLDEVSLSGMQKFMNSSALSGTDAVITGSGDFSNQNSVMTASGSLKLDKAVVQGQKLGYPISTDFDISDNQKSDILSIRKCLVKLGSTTLQAQGTLNQSNSKSPVIDAALRVANGKLDELIAIAKLYGMSAADGLSGSGAINLDVRANGPIQNSEAMKLSGSGALQNATLQTASLTQPLHIRNATLQFAQNAMSLTNVAASLGSTNATGNLSVSNFQAPHLTFALSADKLNVVELEQITSGTSPQQKHRAELHWSLVPRADAAPAPAQPSFLESATGNGTIAVGSIVYQQTTLTNVRSNVTLNRGVIRLDPLTSNIYGGQESGNVTVDTRPTPVTYAINAQLTNVDSNQLLSSVSSVKNTVYGPLGATMNITLATPASGDVVQTLNGTMALKLVNGKIMKLDLPGELSKIGKFGGVSPKGYTAVSQMTGTFNLHNGVAQTNDLKAALDIGTMAATGTMNLVNQGLDLHVTAVLNKGFSQSVGGTGVGGYLNTALANQNGELVLPVLITGSMEHPVVSPDVQQIANMKLNKLLPTAGGLLNGKGGNNIGGLVGGILGQQPQQGHQGAKPSQQQQQQNNPLGDTLNQILGGSKKH